MESQQLARRRTTWSDTRKTGKAKCQPEVGTTKSIHRDTVVYIATIRSHPCRPHMGMDEMAKEEREFNYHIQFI